MESTPPQTKDSISSLTLLFILEIIIFGGSVTLILLPKSMEYIDEAAYLLFICLPSSLLFGMIGTFLSVKKLYRKDNPGILRNTYILLLVLSIIIFLFFPVFFWTTNTTPGISF